MKFKNISQVWEAIESGKTVYWKNDAYQLTIEPLNKEWRLANGFSIPFSEKGDFCLRVTCVSNWFGSLLDEDDLNNLFVK